jgi:hypothetical protein
LYFLAALIGFTSILFAPALPAQSGAAKPVAAAGAKASGSPAATATLEYFEDASGEFKVVTADGIEFPSAELDFGWPIPVGGTLVTFDNDYAEIRLAPSGTIVRISENTNFQIEALQGTAGAAKNVFSMAVGKFRAMAGKAKGAPMYSFKGPSAVCGVRGTDLGMLVVPGEKEIAFVLDGVVDYTNAAGQSLALGAGQMADALSGLFESLQIPPDMMNELLQDLQFQKVSPPQEVVETAEGEAVEAETAAEPDAAPPAAEAKEGPLAKLLQLLGVEIGSVTLGGETYAKAIIQPRLALGKLKLALYLPIIYQSNMFDPNDWYRPEGNDEWSFGCDQDGWDQVALDILDDLLLKIRYIEYGEQRDPFFFKVGNIQGVNLGHGLIMRDYRNDTDFPAVRRTGLNLGGHGKKSGFELLANDLADPEILAARLYYRPMGESFPMALGVSAVTDLNPGAFYQEFPDPLYAKYGRPIFLNAGLDLDLPIVDRDLLRIVLFSDVAAMMPYFRESVPNTTPEVEAGFALDAVWDEDGQRLRNWGFSTGVLGNIAILDYRLEYRYSTGRFRTAFYNALYERLRGEYVRELVQYLQDPANPVYDVKQMGIYGEAGFAIGKLFSLQIGYEWPWYVDDTGDGDMPDDYFLLRAALLKELPVVRVRGSLSYERVRMIPTLLGEGSLTLFDENTVLTGELTYPISPIINLAVLVTTTAVKDEYGDLEPFTSVSVLTRVNY